MEATSHDGSSGQVSGFCDGDTGKLAMLEGHEQDVT